MASISITTQEVAKLERLAQSVAPLAEWLGHFRDQGEQVGNLDMTLVDSLRDLLWELGAVERPAIRG
jgi:predicted membrane chloride channel (bestrophin family)